MQKFEPLLALPSTDVPLVFRNPLSSLVTSLPYIDGEMDSRTKREVLRLIEEEMKTMPQKDYLEDLKLREVNLDKLPYVKYEQERIEKGKPFEAVDTQRYELQSVIGNLDYNDEASLKMAIDKVNILSQHNSFR